MAKEKSSNKEAKMAEELADVAETVENLRNLHNLQGQLLIGLEKKVGLLAK